MRRLWVVSALLLAGCGAAGGWTKPGIDETQMAREYRECRLVADDAVRPEAAINQDILATRGNDWQRAGVAGVQTRAIREQTRDRAAAIVDSCMRAKGFAPAPAAPR